MSSSTNFRNEERRQDFIDRLNHLFNLDWDHKLLVLEEYFNTHKIHSFLIESLIFYDEKDNYPGESIIQLIYKTGFKYKPKNDAVGMVLMNTPIHYVSRLYADDNSAKWSTTVHELFRVLYNNYDYNFVDETGLSHFHVACIYGCDDAVRKFLEAGQHPDCTPREPNTCSVDPPIHFCLMHKRYKLVELLLINGANPNALNTKGQSPLDYAVARLLPNFVDLLLNHGADLSTFVFPIRPLIKRFSNTATKRLINCNNLAKVSSVVLVIESLQNKGYRLEKCKAMKLFDCFENVEFFNSSRRIKDYLQEEKFLSLAKRTMINPNVSLHRLIRLSQYKPSKRVTYKDYWEFANSEEHQTMTKRKDCDAYLCKILAYKFFGQWMPYQGSRTYCLV